MSRCRPAPPATADDLIAQAIDNRPELAALRFSRDAAYKFAEAEKDLVASHRQRGRRGGYIPYINTPATRRFPPSTKASRRTSVFPSSTGICSLPGAKPPINAPWKPISTCAINRSASPRRARGLGQRQRRLSAHRCHRAVSSPGRARPRPRAGPLQSRPVLHRRADAGAVESHDRPKSKTSARSTTIRPSTRRSSTPLACSDSRALFSGSTELSAAPDRIGLPFRPVACSGC